MIEENKNCWLYNNCNHKDCNRYCIRRVKQDYYFNSAFINNKMRQTFPLRVDEDKSDYDNFVKLKEIEKNIVKFVDSGNNLYIYSQNAGNGKTSWSLRLAISYINNTWYSKELKPTVLFISVPSFLLELKSNISEKSEYVNHILKYVNDCDLVIWDDIGSKNGTEFETSHLLSIIDKRINNGKSNIYTSNLSKDELQQSLGDRLYSRIYNYSSVLEFIGSDKRGIHK